MSKSKDTLKYCRFIDLVYAREGSKCHNENIRNNIAGQAT